MTNTQEASLWNLFDLDRGNPDPGGGVLYAIRYDSDSLYSHREAVVQSLETNGATICLTEEGELSIRVAYDGIDNDDIILALVEELSVVNEAIDFHEMGINPSSIDELSDSLKTKFLESIISQDSDTKINALNLVDLGIPQIVLDLLAANGENEVLTDEELDLVIQLGQFASIKSDLYGSHRVIVDRPFFLN